MGWRGLSGGTVVLVHTLHMVEEIVATGETVALDGTITVTEVAEVRSCTVTMHTMSFSLVAEQASRGRELDSHAGLLVATEGLQVRVDILAALLLVYPAALGMAGQLTHSCT